MCLLHNLHAGVIYRLYLGDKIYYIQYYYNHYQIKTIDDSGVKMYTTDTTDHLVFQHIDKWLELPVGIPNFKTIVNYEEYLDNGY